MDKDIIAGKIEDLQKAQQARLTEMAQSDLAWTNMQTAINTWNETLGLMKDEPVDVPVPPKGK